jgi:hypothetical protein
MLTPNFSTLYYVLAIPIPIHSSKKIRTQPNAHTKLSSPQIFEHIFGVEDGVTIEEVDDDVQSGLAMTREVRERSMNRYMVWAFVERLGWVIFDQLNGRRRSAFRVRGNGLLLYRWRSWALH